MIRGNSCKSRKVPQTAEGSSTTTSGLLPRSGASVSYAGPKAFTSGFFKDTCVFWDFPGRSPPLLKDVTFRVTSYHRRVLDLKKWLHRSVEAHFCILTSLKEQSDGVFIDGWRCFDETLLPLDDMLNKTLYHRTPSLLSFLSFKNNWLVLQIFNPSLHLTHTV